MNFNICHECGTENEEEYIYCKNCGVKLSPAQNEEPVITEVNSGGSNFYGGEPEKSPEPVNTDLKEGSFSPEGGFAGENSFFKTAENPGTHSNNSHHEYEPVNGADIIDTIDGIPAGEIGVFIGKKTDSILPKFRKMELTGSKISWCWPTAVLSFFFGPIGAALWFFYRKMYKAAVIFMAIGIIFSGIGSTVTALTYDPTVQDRMGSLLEDYYTSPPSTGEELSLFLEEYIAVIEGLYPAGALIEQLASTACLIITGLFSYYWYKNHAVKKIIEYRRRGNDMRYYQFGLMSVGGTSGGMLTVGIIIMIAAENIISQLVNFLM